MEKKEELLRTAARSVIICFLFLSYVQGFTFPCDPKEWTQKTCICLKGEK